MSTRAAVLGTGSWGTAFAATMADSGSTVHMWGRRQQVVDQVNAGSNAEYLPGIELPPGVRATVDPEEALEGAEVVVLAVPSQTLRDNLQTWASLLPPDAAVVSLMKGIELGTTKRMSEVIAEVGAVDAHRIVVVSGPNLAREIAEKQPAASVVACVDEATAERVATACVTPWFRPYTNDDVIGIELGGAVKNVVALAVGMAAGMGMGDNSKASLITRGLAETARLGSAFGADPATFMGLAGVGDLIATCMSHLLPQPHLRGDARQGMRVAEVVRRTPARPPRASSPASRSTSSPSTTASTCRSSAPSSASCGTRSTPVRWSGADDAVAEVRGRLSRLARVGVQGLAEIDARGRRRPRCPPRAAAGPPGPWRLRRVLTPSFDQGLHPAEAGRVSHSRHRRGDAFGSRRRRRGTSIDDHGAEPRVADPLDRRMVRSRRRDLRGVGALAARTARAGCADPRSASHASIGPAIAAVDQAPALQGRVERPSAG